MDLSQVPDPTLSSRYLSKQTVEFSILTIIQIHFSSYSSSSPSPPFPIQFIRTLQKWQEVHLHFYQKVSKKPANFVTQLLECPSYSASFIRKNKPQKHTQANLLQTDWCKLRRNSISFFQIHSFCKPRINNFKFARNCMVVGGSLRLTFRHQGLTPQVHRAHSHKSPRSEGKTETACLVMAMERGCWISHSLCYIFTLFSVIKRDSDPYPVCLGVLFQLITQLSVNGDVLFQAIHFNSIK